jgi:hypothetical protein
MYTLKREAMAVGAYPKRYPIPILARAFFNMVRKHGRNSEGRLLVALYLQTNPFRMFRNAALGYKLWRRGRLSVGQDHIEHPETLSRMLDAVDREEVVKGVRQ